MSGYTEFIASRNRLVSNVGTHVDPASLHPDLFPFQRQIVAWAARKGRAALFADTGLGKSFMQLEWARRIGGRVLILAPLAVAAQTVREGDRRGITVTHVREPEQLPANGIAITNYERLDKFDGDWFDGVVLDESSILKDFGSKTRSALIDRFSETRYRLCCTATPAPNDISEIGNHAEFLGVGTRVEMLASFFVHDERDWRLKGHAHEPFFRWLASWSMSVRRPSDLGFDDGAYVLPALHMQPVMLPTSYVPEGQLFATTVKGVGDRAKVRKATTAERVAKAAELIAAEPNEQWIAWCGLNDEARSLAAAIPGAVNVEGADSPEAKAERLLAFADGSIRVLVTKPGIAGFGMNFQNCARMVFVGIGDSYETYYQAVRRAWRFGQARPVYAYVVLTDIEDAIYANVLRKERDARALADDLIAHVATLERDELSGVGGRLIYEATKRMEMPAWIAA